MKYLRCAVFIAATTILADVSGQHWPDAYDFCAVQLEVVESDDNEPVVSAVAELIGPAGRVIQTQKVVNGHAQFCDFGFGDHSILVRDENSDCASTEIRKIHVIYGFTQKFKVAMNSCVGEADMPGTACGTYIRVIAPNGKALKAVNIKYDKTEASEFTDTYGRAKVGVLEGRSQSFTFTKPGYKSQKLVLRCDPPLQGKEEVLVIMQLKDWMKKR